MSFLVGVALGTAAGYCLKKIEPVIKAVLAQVKK